MIKKPEDVAIDKTGVVHTATRDGNIMRLYKNGTWDIWCHIDSSITLTKAGDLVVCDAEKVTSAQIFSLYFLKQCLA